MKYALIPIYLVLTILGLIFMKLGGNPGQISVKDGNFMLSMSTVSLIGFICYIGSFLLFTRLVVMFDISWIYPITAGIVQIATLISAYVIFKEDISILGVIGIILVIVGIVIMNIKIPNNKNNNGTQEISEQNIINNN